MSGEKRSPAELPVSPPCGNQEVVIKMETLEAATWRKVFFCIFLTKLRLFFFGGVK